QDRNPLSFLLAPSAATQAVKPVPETTAFIVEQTNLLRRIVSKLEADSDAIFGKESGSEMDIDQMPAKDTERALYVEKMSRRHLEKARGLQLNSEGGLKTGEGEPVGLKKTESDVLALEGLLGKVGNGTERV